MKTVWNDSCTSEEPIGTKYSFAHPSVANSDSAQLSIILMIFCPQAQFAEDKGKESLLLFPDDLDLSVPWPLVCSKPALTCQEHFKNRFGIIFSNFSEDWLSKVIRYSLASTSAG